MSAGPPPGALPLARHERRAEWRLMLVILAFLCGYAVLGGGLAMMALSRPAEPQRAAADAARPPVRGPVTDRTGRLLAANLPAWSLYANPAKMRDIPGTAAALAPIFPGLEADEIERRLRASDRFAWIERPVTPRQRQAVLDLKPARPALEFGRRDMRVYPAGRMAAHIMGGVRSGRESVHSAALVGAGGVEQAFDAYLRDPAAMAEPLALSIDLTVQAALTEVLGRGVERYGAIRGSAILMKVETGEILAMVSLPDFDPNAPVTAQGLEGEAENPRFNQTVSGVYELGSVFKPLTAAMALELGVARADTKLRTGRPIREGGYLIRDLHHMPEFMTVTDVISRSSNIGAARLAQRMGTERLKAMLARLGMFEPVGIELPEAARPLKPRRWTDLSSLTISYGHGLSVTPLHLVSAYATIAAGGEQVVPSLVRGGRARGERIFSEETAQAVLAMLRKVVTDGTARRLDAEGYRVGGKTGTADKRHRDRPGYDRTRTRASFASVFPIPNPQYAMLVLIDEPTDPETGSRQASRSAVPVTAEAIRRIAPLLRLEKKKPEPRPMASAIVEEQTITVGLSE